MQRGSLGLLVLSLALCSALSARAADELASLHYSDLQGIRQQVEDLKDLKQLRVALYVVSSNPAVAPQSIKMVMHRASGQLTDIPVDPTGRIDLPKSDELMNENPLITTNQPKHSLNATIVIDVAPPTRTDMTYAELMLGVQQFNTAILRNSTMASLFDKTSTGILLFYNDAGHSLKLHGPKGDQVIKSLPVADVKDHMPGTQNSALLPSTTVIYVPLDDKLLKENPKLTLDRLPDDLFPGF
jgi:hypothetical protein